MYPNLYYFFKDLFGIELNFLKIINSFGFFVAMGFIVGAWVLTNELKRKQAQGLFVPTEIKIITGKPASVGELVMNFFLGFIFGYKILGVLLTPNALENPQDYILSLNGNLFFGIVFGAIATVVKWYEFNKLKSDKPEERTIRIWPHDRVGDIVIYAAVFGFLGAKLFHNFENWNEFIKDPIGALISFSGLTFYGGLICAAIGIYFYSRKNNIKFIHLADALAPTMLMAYAIGRIGCQVSGDGDWGVLNSALISDINGNSIVATTQQFNEALQNSQNYFVQHYHQSINEVHHISVKPFLGLPNWLFGYTYPHNVINEGVALNGCTGNYCNALPMPVFPTPFYETLMCIALFGILIWIKSKTKVAGLVFGIYLMMNGFERFIIEKIRVNTVYDIWGFHPTQAEIISSFLFILGVGIVIWSKTNKNKN